MPCLSSALAYFDGYRSERLPAICCKRAIILARTPTWRGQNRESEFFHTHWTATAVRQLRPTMPENYFIVPATLHNQLIEAAYRHRGYNAEEAKDGARFCELASTHGIRTHNGIKALHLDEHFGSKVGGCTPGAKLEKLPTKFKAVQRWNANKKLGQSVAFEAMDTCMKLADEFGVGVVSVDNAFHYLWGGGYVIDAAQKGYIAYTNCTSALAEVAIWRQVPDAGYESTFVGVSDDGSDRFPICGLGNLDRRDGTRPTTKTRGKPLRLIPPWPRTAVRRPIPKAWRCSRSVRIRVTASD